jgi:hypothetical protein
MHALLLLLLLLPGLVPVCGVAVRIWQPHNRCWAMDAWQPRVCCCCRRRRAAAAGPVHAWLQQRLLLLLLHLLLLLLLRCALLLLWLKHHLLLLLLLRQLLLWHRAATAGAAHRHRHRSLHLQLHWLLLLLLLLPLCELHWRRWARGCACTNLRPPLRPALLLLLHPHHSSRGLHLWHTNARWYSAGVT